MNINLQNCNEYLNHKYVSKYYNIKVRKANGKKINNDDIFKHCVSYFMIPKITFCYMRWVQKQSWEETGVYEYMEKLIEESNGKCIDGCRTLADIHKRYNNLDLIYLEAQKEKTLRKQKFGNNILIHLNKGKPIFAGGGCHRFAISKILNLECVPVDVGLIYE